MMWTVKWNLPVVLMRLLSDKELVDKTSREARKIVESISVEGNAGIWDNVFARITARQ